MQNMAKKHSYIDAASYCDRACIFIFIYLHICCSKLLQSSSHNVSECYEKNVMGVVDTCLGIAPCYAILELLFGIPEP